MMKHTCTVCADRVASLVALALAHRDRNIVVSDARVLLNQDATDVVCRSHIIKDS